VISASAPQVAKKQGRTEVAISLKFDVPT